MKQLIFARFITAVKLATELYVGVQCFFLLHAITHEFVFAILAATILLALGQVPTVTTVVVNDRLQRLACSSIHCLILVVVETLSTFILFKRNEAVLLAIFGTIASPTRIFLGLLLLIAAFKVAVLLLPKRTEIHVSASTRTTLTLLPRRNLVMTLSIEEEKTVCLRLDVRGGTADDVDVMILKENGETVMALDRISRRSEWCLHLAKGRYLLHVQNQFSVIASKKVKLKLFDGPTPTFIWRAILNAPFLQDEPINSLTSQGAGSSKRSTDGNSAG